MTNLLEVQGLNSGYGGSQALFDVDMHVAEGELVALIGSNGAGKSTLLKSLSGWLKPWAGTIRFAGRAIESLAPNKVVRLGVAHCPEGRRVFPELTVHENLQVGAYARRNRSVEDLDKVFELFPRLRERRTQQAGTLSGGEQQMLAIGRGLMSAPRLLLLDEPSLGLAPVVVEQVMDAVGRVAKEAGMTIVLVEQNAALALSIADRAYVMEGGMVVKEGPGSGFLDDEEVRRAYLGI
jgi:branched-chain amino acid transport system ATP-binding protein